MKSFFVLILVIFIQNCAYQTNDQLNLTSTLKIENTSGTALTGLYIWEDGEENGSNQIELAYGLTGLASGEKAFAYPIDNCDKNYNIRVDFYRGITLLPLPYTATAYFECNRTVIWRITGESEGQIIYK
ncbi:MAG: hypothetical protein P8O70_15055 [SAR324 cluster bacterium]|nr:hypothetical protein [SAR324 cluster bacterium]